MNKKLITLALSGILYVSPTFALTQTQSAVQSTADYAQVVSKRQVVDQLLEQAVTAFKSPARISHAGFTAKMPSNMEIVTDRLLQAYQLEPYRTDLLISAA
ncbi:transporter, partial [Photobacterium damselae subsp. damselae]|nr:transporter [Photobacterium damselae subsp. damselae]